MKSLAAICFSVFLLALAPPVESAPTVWGVVGAVYTMTNDDAGNHVLVYDRHADGSLAFAAAYPTDGLGSGDGLGNQGGVVLSDNGLWLLAVNAGSDDISLFRVTRFGLELADVAASGGVRPVSVAIHNDLVYVLNAGGTVGDEDSIFGFRLGRKARMAPGGLVPLTGSGRPLSADNTAPAQIGFSPNGRALVITEKATSLIAVFPLDRKGFAGSPEFNVSSGMTPFAFDFGKRNQLFVSEVFGGAEDAGAVSSYLLGAAGKLEVIDPSVPNTETAPCWLVVTPGGRHVFTTNTPDDSLSGYSVDFNGFLTLLDEDGRTGEPGPGTRPLDMDLSNDGRFLYTLNIGDDTISTFRVGKDGSLTLTDAIGGVPDGANGLAAR